VSGPQSGGPYWRGAVDPRQAETGATPRRKTFGECADALLASKRSEWRSDKHAKQWQISLNVDCATIRDMPIDEVDTLDVLAVLKPLWQIKHESASRTRQRIELTLDYATAHKFRTGENPARWRGHLALMLPKRQKLDRGHHAALAYDKVPEFLAELRKRGTVAASALEFAILTAARRGEVICATWAEIDLAAKVWTVPAACMKAGREHRVPLSDPALAVLDRMAVIRSGDFVFPGARSGRPLSGKTVSRLLDGIDGTVHGMRSGFRDWCGNETHYPRELAETALAHVAGDSTEQAYRRSDALERRRELMSAWAQFCCEPKSINVISIGSRKNA
jgi:integrase